MTSLSVKELVERMNDVPTFAIMNDTARGKKFVPMKFADDGDTTLPEVCAFFIDPIEAKKALVQAGRACPDMNLVLGVMPLGNAFALVVGWAEAQGDRPFTIRGSAALTSDMRPHLKRQLESEGLPSYWQLPVIVCDELQSATALPVFLTHAGLSATWKAAGRLGAPPTQLKILDLRLLVQTMLAPFRETGMDWRVVRFVGSELASRVVQQGLDHLDAAGGIGSGKASGDVAALAEEAAINKAALEATHALHSAVLEKADPDIHPPPLEPAVPDPTTAPLVTPPPSAPPAVAAQ